MQKDRNIITSYKHTNNIFILKWLKKDKLLTLGNKQALNTLIFKIQKSCLQSIIDKKIDIYTLCLCQIPNACQKQLNVLLPNSPTISLPWENVDFFYFTYWIEKWTLWLLQTQDGCQEKFKRIRNIQIDHIFILKGFGNHALLP